MGVTFSPRKGRTESARFEVITEVVKIAVGFSETLVPIYQNIWRHILGNSDLGRLTSRMKC
jgi:hypothetical protein